MSPPQSPSDLDALRATLERLQGEQTWSRTILETVPAVVLRVSLDGAIEFINRILPEYEGNPPVGNSVYDFAPPDQHDVMRAALERTVQTLQPSSYESLAVAPDGTRDWYVTNVGPFLDDGKLVALTLVCTNASRARKAEAELVESRIRLKLALDAGNVGVWRWEMSSDSVEWDEKLNAMFGLPADKSPHTLADFLALIPDDQRPAMTAHIERALATSVYPDFELRADLPGGTRWFIIKGGVLRDAEGKIASLMGGFVDVTERRLIEEHLRQTQKLEAIGQLSAGVAHNFNNMLAVILPALERARTHAKDVDAELLDDAITSADNAAQLVQQLTVFSRSGHRAIGRREPLAEVVRRAVDLCKHTFERSVTLETGDLGAAHFASVDAGAMEQVMMNLLLNARDALGHDQAGPARIEISAQLVPERVAALRHADACGDYVELRVMDTGCGMDATARRRMLEPFFTTKPVGRGTGLGLSTAWATLQAHHGFLECDSEVNRGTTFLLLLPRSDAVSELPVPRPMPTPMGGNGRVVLIIDDERNVRRATAAMLEQAGFNVLSAASGEEGLELAASASIDVVLLDYSMPGLSAQETLAGLRRVQPQLPVVCLSGLEIALVGATAQLVKPVAGSALVAALESVLAAV